MASFEAPSVQQQKFAHHAEEVAGVEPTMHREAAERLDAVLGRSSG